MNAKDVIIIAGVSALALWAFGMVRGIQNAFRNAGEALGSGLYELFHPDPLGETLFFTAKFPDGSQHAIPSRAVAADGTFLNRNLAPNYPGDGKRYRLLVNLTKTSGVNKEAYPV